MQLIKNKNFHKQSKASDKIMFEHFMNTYPLLKEWERITSVSNDDGDDKELIRHINKQLEEFSGGKLGDLWPDDSTCPKCRSTRQKKKLFVSDYWQCPKCDK